MAAIAVAVIAAFAIKTGTDRIYDLAEREAEQIMKEIALAGYPSWDETQPYDNAWKVVPQGDKDRDWTEPYFGTSDVEPPLSTIVDQSGGVASFARFEQDGTWLALAEPQPNGDWTIAALPLADYENDASSLRLGIVLAAIGSILGTSLIGYWLAGRSLRPARMAMAQQRDFIADAAHELRTPLAVIQASAGHTLSRDRSDEEYRDSLTEILTATSRAGSSVSELLELARLDAGQAQPRMAPLRADLLVEEVAASIRIDDVTITADADTAIIVDADYSLLRQVIDTLTRNSAARARTIQLGAEKNGTFGKITILDDGPGFDESVLPHVFDRFRRGDSIGSSGLGMAIAKKIVEAHGGEITAGNRATGGAVVTLTVPLDTSL